MTPIDWQAFIDRGHGTEVVVAQVSLALMSHLGANSDQVFMDHRYVLKSVHQHQISVEAFESLSDILAYGQVLEDRERHLVFLFENRVGWFHVVVKRAEASGRLYIATFHRTTSAKAAAKRRRFLFVRE